MNTTVQMTTASGAIIEDAKWDLPFQVTPVEGHIIMINVPTKDRSLLEYMAKADRRGVIFDGDKENGYTVTLSCPIRQVKHLIDIAEKSVQTLVLAAPENRASEQILLYLFDTSKCDPSFMKALGK